MTGNRPHTVSGRAVAILAGGAIGALARAGLTEWLPHGPGEWPWSTFIVNLPGALFLGWLLRRLAERLEPTIPGAAGGHGVRGALTTFSTFQVEIFELAREGYAGLGVGYALISVSAGMALAVTGIMAARRGWHP